MLTSYEMRNLLFRRQFIAINQEISGFDGWRHESLNHKGEVLNLYLHPDLECKRGKNRVFELLIIGYILDPEFPALTDSEIHQELLRLGTFDEVVHSLEKYNGRYAVIYSDRDILRTLNDPTGFREIYYLEDKEKIAFGSTPDIIAEALSIDKTEDQDIINFFTSDEYKKANCTWMGQRTLYDNVLLLIPNHYLDLINGNMVRFWPDKTLKRIELEDCAQECADILKGTFESAVNRYDLHMGITAGWDSRLLLSATKDFKEKIFYYVNKPTSYSRKHKDISLPLKMSKRFNLNLNIVEIPSQYDEAFRDIMYRNNVLARDDLISVFQEVIRRKWDHTFTVSGTLGNGVPRIYKRIPDDIEVKGKHIAVFSGYNQLPYPVKDLDKWALEAKTICEKAGVNIMDLAQIEQDHWASLTSSEQDIAREEIRPFNNRKLISLFWSLNEKYRYQFYPLAYIRIMQILWTEVLDFPLNPSTKSLLYKCLRILGIERKVYKYYKKRKFIKTIK